MIKTAVLYKRSNEAKRLKFWNFSRSSIDLVEVKISKSMLQQPTIISEIMGSLRPYCDVLYASVHDREQ